MRDKGCAGACIASAGGCDAVRFGAVRLRGKVRRDSAAEKTKGVTGRDWRGGERRAREKRKIEGGGEGIHGGTRGRVEEAQQHEVMTWKGCAVCQRK
eukprot:2187747-Rhodomonas_salina.2